MDLVFHALANEYPLMPAYELGRMEEGMKEDGFDSRFPIVLFKKQILDGRNRYLAAKAAKVKAVFVTFKGTDEEARRFVQKANEERRHLADDWLKRRREERVQRVATKREEGKSERAIAEEENISRAQVKRDLEDAQLDRGGPVEPKNGQVTGKDGRTRTATPARKPTPPPEEKEKSDAEKTKDDIGIPIQEHALTAFEAVPKFAELLSLLRKADKLYSEIADMPGGAYLQRPGISINARDRWKHKGIQTAILNVVDCKPSLTVCPYTMVENHKHGKDCPLCHGLNWTRPIGKDESATGFVEKLKETYCG